MPTGVPPSTTEVARAVVDGVLLADSFDSA